MLLRTRTQPDRTASPADRLTPAHLAVGRTAAGTVMLLRPRLLPTAMGVDSAAAARVGWAVQMLGAREVALGLGTLAALRRGDRGGSRLWLAAGVVADGLDLLVVGGALVKGRVRASSGLAVAAVAGGAAALGARAVAADEQVAPL